MEGDRVRSQPCRALPTHWGWWGPRAMGCPCCCAHNSDGVNGEAGGGEEGMFGFLWVSMAIVLIPPFLAPRERVTAF